MRRFSSLSYFFFIAHCTQTANHFQSSNIQYINNVGRIHIAEPINFHEDKSVEPRNGTHTHKKERKRGAEKTKNQWRSEKIIFSHNSHIHCGSSATPYEQKYCGKKNNNKNINKSIEVINQPNNLSWRKTNIIFIYFRKQMLPLNRTNESIFLWKKKRRIYSYFLRHSQWTIIIKIDMKLYFVTPYRLCVCASSFVGWLNESIWISIHFAFIYLNCICCVYANHSLSIFVSII